MSARAMPKSMILTTPPGVTMKLAGLMSRWTRFIGWPLSPIAEWAWASPRQIWIAIWTTIRGGSGPWLGTRWRICSRVSPSTNSIEM